MSPAGFPFPPRFLPGPEVSRYARELHELLTGSFVQKVYQTEDGILALSLSGDLPWRWLTFLYRPDLTSIYLAEEKPGKVPPEPPAFCHLLRKDLVGKPIRDVEQVGSDRILAFRMGYGERVLVLECIPRRSNAILLEENGGIRGCLRNEPERDLRPGGNYTPPVLPEGRQDGVPEEIGRGTGPVFLYLEDGIPRLASAVQRTGFGEGVREESRESLVQALHELYETILPRVEFLSRKKTILDALRGEQKRLRRDLEAARGDLEKAGREEDHRKRAEMILAQPRRVSRGMASARLEDFYDPAGGEIEVALDPLLSPAENAQKYFQKASRAARTARGARDRIAFLEERLARIGETLGRLETSVTVEDLAELADRIPASRKQKDPSKDKREEEDPIRKVARVFTSRDGYPIFVGKGDRLSDELLRRHVRGNDLWLHTRDVPGAHVVVPQREKGREIPQETVLDAAHLAAYYSKSRGEKSVPLYMTEVKHLRRPKGGASGKVIVGIERGFDVRIEEDRLERLVREEN